MSEQTGSSGAASPFSVLLVDDEQDALYGYSAMFRGAGFTHVLTETDSRRVLALMEAQPVDLVVLDLQMPHLGGFELLTRIRERHPQVPVIIVTAANELDMAVACMKAGATDYFVKPVEKSRLVGSARRTLETHDLRTQLDRLRSSLLEEDACQLDAFNGIVTRSERMRRIFQYLNAVACSPQPVMVTGETGTGKELAARAVHVASRRSGAFVAVNLAGLDDQIFSDTLFGHLKGAFTGADHKRDGLIARAAGGTLFLDEIGDLQPGSQVKLLRLLQDGDYFPLGSDIPHRCDARIVAASHHDLNGLQREHRFRPDLYYRLCTHKVHLPNLAERSEDIPLLLAHFLTEAARDMNRKVPTPARTCPLPAVLRLSGQCPRTALHGLRRSCAAFPRHAVDGKLSELHRERYRSRRFAPGGPG